MIVRADTDANVGAAQRLHVGVQKVFLAEMDEVAALVDGGLPVVVDDELRTAGGTDRLGLLHLATDLGRRLLLDAKLDQPRAGRDQARHPAGIRNDRIERVEHGHPPSTALPITGVDGTAMSRGSIGWARWAAWPASTASAKARAISTGSPASAIAVLSSTAS